MGILDRILKTAASDYIYTPVYPDPKRVPPPNIVAPDSQYVSIMLRSMRIVDIRRGWTKFYPFVHSYMTIPHRGTGLAEFQTVTTPTRLAELDTSNLDRVLFLNHRLLGPVPHRGGDLRAEIGLFSVKSSDLAQPFLEVLESLATKAGVSFVSAAAPFVEPLKKGLESLTGSKECGLEIGIATTITALACGDFAVIRAKRGTYDSRNLRLAEDYRLEDASGSSIDSVPYFVFSIECSATRDDWFRIPEISSRHAELVEAVQKDRVEEFKELFESFKRTAITSPDLLRKDAERLVKEVSDDLSATVPASMTGREKVRKLRPLEEIPLF